MSETYCPPKHKTRLDWHPSLRPRAHDWSPSVMTVCVPDEDELQYAKNVMAQCKIQNTLPHNYGLSRYTFSDGESRDFVLSSPDIISALRAALSIVGDVFGDSAKLSLALAPDTDDTAFDCIVCYIGANKDIDEALRQLSAFRKVWRSLPDRAKGKLSFTVKID